MFMIESLKKDLERLGNPEKKAILQRFFKTGAGQYGEGDVLLGVKVPEQRSVAKKYKDLGLESIQKLLSSQIHEHRLTGLLILVENYKSGSKKQAFEFYLKNLKGVNNWDLVDLTAPNIVGEFLLENPEEKDILYKLANSKSLWEKRIAIIATFAFIRKGQFSDTLKISEIILKDKHDLIHKAVGWMLREVGKRDQKTEEQFLEKHAREMPRTMLRYAIERFSPEKRKYYMKR